MQTEVMKKKMLQPYLAEIIYYLIIILILVYIPAVNVEGAGLMRHTASSLQGAMHTFHSFIIVTARGVAHTSTPITVKVRLSLSNLIILAV